MGFIRKKTINGKEYLYHVESKRVGEKVVQKHIKYIGVADMENMVIADEKVVPKNQKPLILDANSELSFNKYDLSQANVIGKGSDRIVAELPNGDVIKVAITPRGIVQNQSEGDYYAPVPEVKDSGIDYVVVEKIQKNKETDKEMRKILKPYEKFSQDDFNKKTSELQTQFEKTDEKYGTNFSDLQNYDLLFGDFKRVSSWGMKDKQPVLIDAGTLNNKIGKLNSQEQVYKEYAYTRNDWNTILTERRNSKNTILKSSTKIQK